MYGFGQLYLWRCQAVAAISVEHCVGFGRLCLWRSQAVAAISVEHCVRALRPLTGLWLTV